MCLHATYALGVGDIEDEHLRRGACNNEACGAAHRSAVAEEHVALAVGLQLAPGLQADVIEEAVGGGRFVICHGHLRCFAFGAAPRAGTDIVACLGVDPIVSRDGAVEELRAVDRECDVARACDAGVSHEAECHSPLVCRDAWHGEGEDLRKGAGEALSEEFAAGACLAELLEELAVYLVQQVFVEGVGLACGACVGGRCAHVDGGCGVGHEVVAVHGVGVILMAEEAALAVVAPLDWPAAVEEDVVRGAIDGCGGQVVDVGVAREVFVEYPSAIAVDGHFGWVGKAHRAELGVGELIDAVVWDADFHPSPFGQRGASRIASGGGSHVRGGCGPENDRTAYSR